ncbi:hypothetical protein JXB41_08440 [Candidatus Woesearchaeota archaeon]|nr:hypothetical protein [Candidatus Woesearchaeota archaeon]
MKKIIFILLAFILISPFAMARTGSMKILATSEINEKQYGSSADLFLEVKAGSGRIFIDSFPLTKLDTVMSTRFANEIACDFLEKDCSKYDFFYTIRANAAIVGGPSAGAAISVLTISVLENIPLDEKASITGTINSGGLIGPVGGINEKIEFAGNINLSRVLIPRWTNINDSALENLSEETNVEIIKISNLRDAIFELTGKEIGKNYSLLISSDYSNTMKNISEEICKRTESLLDKKENNTLSNEAFELYIKGNESFLLSEFYSSASYCFGANVKLRYLSLLNQDLPKKEILDSIYVFDNTTKDFKEYISRKKINTLTDLETYMVVTERIIDAREYFRKAGEDLNENLTNSSIYNLAFGIERLNSAISWSLFFNQPGKKFNLDKDSIKESCLKKLSEVEERIEYAKLYLPLSLENIKQEVKYAYADYISEEYSLCLFKASKAKAEINIILNSLGLSENQLDLIIQDRLNEAEQIIGRQIQNNVFPIVGYSYYEYAKSLKEKDEFSTLLYLEYAIELSKLDIYFKQKRFEFPIIEKYQLIIFGLGFVWGFLICYILIKRKFLISKKR